jgi:hypothetical protein
MNLTKELIDEYTAYVMRDQQKELFSELDNKRYSELLNEVVLPAYKQNPELPRRIQHIINYKRQLWAAAQLHDLIKRHLLIELDGILL